ncbi:MAG: DUF1844 domain-containing protein [bacterium]
MAEDERESQKSFKVQDRRRFSATGEARDDPAAAAAPAAAAPPPPAPPSSPAAEAPDAAAFSAAGGPSALSFTTFVMSLITQALALLGEIPDPIERAARVDLEAARQLIDILGILSDKTRGNLDAGEAALLDGALYDLRMKYVERANSR